MREIKFRAWDKQHKKFINKFVSTIKITSVDDINKGFKHFTLVWLQFTGLKDKKNKEIYEGDILNWDNECTILIKTSEQPINFYYEILTQKDKNIAAFDIRLHRSDESSKIIGNIYENPELLKDLEK